MWGRFSISAGSRAIFHEEFAVCGEEQAVREGEQVTWSWCEAGVVRIHDICIFRYAKEEVRNLIFNKCENFVITCEK